MTIATSSRDAIPLRWRTSIAVAVTSVVGAIGLGWPFLVPNVAAHSSGNAPWLFLLLIPLVFAILFAEFGDGGLDAKSVAVLGILAGVGAALRPVSGGATGFSFEFVLLILGGRALGRGFGFVLGALTLLASALVIAGMGPWLPYQMVAAGWIGFGAGCLPRCHGRREIALLAAYGAVTGLLFGLLLNLSFWPFAHYYPHQIAFLPHASATTNLVHWLRFDITTSLGFDIPRAIGNAVLVIAVGRPVLLALERVGRRAAFVSRPA